MKTHKYMLTLPDGLYKSLMHLKADTGQTIHQLIIEAIQEKLSGKPKKDA